MLIYLRSLSRFAQSSSFSEGNKREQPCLKSCCRNLPSPPQLPTGMLPPSHPGSALSTLRARLLLLTPGRGKPGLAGAVGHASHLPHGFRCSQGDNPQGCAGDTPQLTQTSAPLPGEPRRSGAHPSVISGSAAPSTHPTPGSWGGSRSLLPSRCSPHLPSRSWGPLAVVGSVMQNVV